MTHSDARFRGKLIPYGGDFSRNSIINSSSSYACNKQSTGDICAALKMKDSWQIKKDYLSLNCYTYSNLLTDTS